MTDLALHLISETTKTVTLGWTPPAAAQGYVYLFPNGTRSSTLDGKQSSVKVAKSNLPVTVRAFRTDSEGVYPPPGFTPPASIAADGSRDVTAELNTWLAAVPDGNTVTFPGRYRVDGTLELVGRMITLAGGVFFTPLVVEGRPVWRLRRGTIVMRDVVVQGGYVKGGVFDAALQHAHGIEVLGANVDLDVVVSQVAGDGVYFGLDGTTPPSGSVRGSLTKCGRNGVSLVAGRTITIANNTIDEVGYDIIDLEPNVGVAAGVIDGVLIENNTLGDKFGVTCYSIVPNQPIRNVVFRNNHAKVGKLSSADMPVRPSNISFVGNTTEQATTASFNNIDGLTVSGNSANYTILKTGVDTPPASTVPFGSRPAYTPPSWPQYGPGKFEIRGKHIKGTSLDLQGFTELVFVDCDFDDAMVYMLNCTGTITGKNIRMKNVRHNAFQFNGCHLEGTVSFFKVKGGRSEDVISVINGGGVSATRRLIFEDFQTEGGDGVDTIPWTSGSGSGLMNETSEFVTFRRFSLLNPGQVGIGTHLGRDVVVDDFQIHTEQSYVPRGSGDIAIDVAQAPQTAPLQISNGKVQWFRRDGSQNNVTAVDTSKIVGWSTTRVGYPFSTAEIAAMRVAL